MERKRRIILIGRSTAGKTTLCQRINHEELQYHKTQTVQIVNQSMIDTPGEYLERRYPYLKKRPYLLPVAWAQRLAHYASEKQSGADSSASGSIKLAKERIELMKQYGIMD